MTRVWVWLLVTAAVKLRMPAVTCWTCTRTGQMGFACASSSRALGQLGEQLVEADIQRIVRSMETTVPVSEVRH